MPIRDEGQRSLDLCRSMRRGKTCFLKVLASLAGLVVDLNERMVNLQGMAKMLITSTAVWDERRWYQTTRKSNNINALFDVARKTL